MRLLRRLGPRPDLLEVYELSMILGLVLRPDFLHRRDLLAQLFPPGSEGRAVVLHLFNVPATADAEDETSVRQVVEAGYFLSGRDGVALDDQADARAELQLRG